MKRTPPRARLLWIQPARRTVWPAWEARRSLQVWVRYGLDMGGEFLDGIDGINRLKFRAEGGRFRTEGRRDTAEKGGEAGVPFKNSSALCCPLCETCSLVGYPEVSLS